MSNQDFTTSAGTSVKDRWAEYIRKVKVITVEPWDEPILFVSQKDYEQMKEYGMVKDKLFGEVSK